ncbi:hypothetical protein LOTGIDRAFT_176635, partial [Lottia gigantea]
HLNFSRGRQMLQLSLSKTSKEQEKQSKFVKVVDETVPVFHMPEIANMNNEEALLFLAELIADDKTDKDGDDSAEVSLCEVESFLPTMEAVFEICPLVTNVELKDDQDYVPSVQDEHDSIIAKEEPHANKTVKRKLVLEESVF